MTENLKHLLLFHCCLWVSYSIRCFLFLTIFFFLLLFNTYPRNNVGENIYTLYKTRKPLVFSRWRRLRYLFISGLHPLAHETKTFVCSLNKQYVTGPRRNEKYNLTTWKKNTSDHRIHFLCARLKLTVHICDCSFFFLFKNIWFIKSSITKWCSGLHISLSKPIMNKI